MCKWVFAVVGALVYVSDFSAFAAVNTRNRTTAVETKTAGTVRSASRQSAATTRGSTSARAAVNPTVQSGVTARAAATQKVINTGTKVAGATENTLVSQECQDAFYGCMDAFCMLDNASGGRCRCSDRIIELDKALDEILKLDEQSYAMATEGVDRINMGDSADEVMANAKAVADRVSNKEETDKKKTTRLLDLSAWDNNIFSEDDMFEGLDMSFDSTETEKTGKALYTSSAKLCLGQMPTQCRSSLTLLQNVYAQKIKSDCIAYENSLKAQKNASAQKLQAAEKALRDAALEKYQEQNKYGLGQCQIRYAQCMQGTAGCGTDYTGCVTLAAAENVKSSGTAASSKKAKQTTIKGTLSSIKLAASTIDQLTSKKPICDDEVLKYCVNVKDKVWNAFLVEAAPALKSAELVAEDKLRQNCITDVAECFQSHCKAQFDPSREMGQYDMCLSEPELLIDLCKVKLEPCLEATGGSLAKYEDSRLWQGVSAILNAMRVDTCTLEVKDCIEGYCGSDFATCVGMTPDSIAGLCPTEKLTACMEKNKNDKDKVMEYIAEIAQGYALQINDALATQCENAARQAMVKVCGDTDTCESLSLGNIAFDGLLKPQLCKENATNCSNTAQTFTQAEILNGLVTAQITDRININAVNFSGNKFEYLVSETDRPGYVAHDSDVVQELLKGLTNTVNKKIEIMEQDSTVYQCIHGKNVVGFRGKTISNNTSKKPGFNAAYNNLLDSYEDIIRTKALELLRDKYERAETDLRPELDALTDQVSARLTNITAAEAEKVRFKNQVACARKALEINVDNNSPGAETTIEETEDGNFKVNSTADGDSFALVLVVADFTWESSGKGCGKTSGFCSKGDQQFFRTGEGRNKKRKALYWATPNYDETTGKCSITTTRYDCTNFLTPYCWNWDVTGVQDASETIQMPRPNLETMIQNAQSPTE